MSRNKNSRIRRVGAMTRRRIRATLGDLIAAAYDALGPDAGAPDVARLLTAPMLSKALSPRYRAS